MPAPAPRGGGSPPPHRRAASRRPALLVVNRVPPRGSMAEAVMAELAALGPAAAARLGNRVAFAASMGEGRTVMETEPAGKAAAEVAALAGELGERLRAG